MKYLFVVLDGGGDIGPQTPLSLAKKPTIDFLAKSGIVGLLDLKYRERADSDVGYLKLLGCYSDDTYPGRGYLEALGLGLSPGEEDVCIRANFVTLDSRGNVIDRRAGRDERGLDRFCKLLDGMEIDGVHFTVKKSQGHRVVIILSGKNVSEKIISNDPKRTGVPLPQIAPKDKSAKFTASVLNRFLYKARKILSEQPENRERTFPANALIIRNAGRKKTTKSFRERFSLNGVCISAMPVAKGVARFLGMNVLELDSIPEIDYELCEKTEEITGAVNDYDFVFLHFNGTDILSHNRDREGKRRFIEKIDQCLGTVLKGLDLKDMIVVITCDHRTASLPEYKGYEHLTDPVPVLIAGKGIEPDRIEKFDEEHAEQGSFKLEGNDLLYFIRRRIEK